MIHPFRTFITSGYRAALSTVCWLAFVALTALAVADDSPPPAEPATLHLGNGGFVTGSLIDSDQSNIIRWKSPSFESPLDFELSKVGIVHFPNLPNLPDAQGDFCVELAGNDVLFGSLVSLTADAIELQTAPFGRLHIQRNHVTRLYRWGDHVDLIYLGPNGLTGWREPSNNKLWKEESGHLVTASHNSAIFADFGIPPQANVEFEISWKSQPDFVFALGASDDPKSLQRSFRFEVWENELIVLREGANQADLASLQEVNTNGGRVQLQAFIDQQQGKISVYSITGKKLAELTVPDDKPQPLTGMWLANKQGDVRLERLRIVRWNGQPPVEVQADKARVHQQDGTISYGQVNQLDAATGEVVIVDEGKETRVSLQNLDGIYLPTSNDVEPPPLRASYQDGTRLSGELVKIGDGALWLKAPGITEQLRAPIFGLFSLVVLRPEPQPQPESDQPIGRLELPGVQLSGRLMDGQDSPDHSCLVWQPLGSVNSSALLHGVSGRIVYRDPPPKINPSPEEQQRQMIMQQQRQQAQPAGLVGQFLRVFSDDQTSGGVVVTSRGAARRALHLRTGDSIPCDVTLIDERGVTFATTISDATFVPHEKIKALELVNEQSVAKIDRMKRDRLLTLPRLQKENPPTHLIRSRSGDYLRGRLLEMNDKELKVEIRLETKAIPRDRVSRIIWLHNDELETVAHSGNDSATRVQAVRRDGIRLTFSPKGFANATLSGQSDVLGPCHVELSEIDQLLIGAAIEEEAAMLAFQQWKLQNAKEPKAFADTDSSTPGSPNLGNDSPLVGQPAPDFQLGMLNGEIFHLEEHRGKIVVLDFWATWCGPCMQSMPEVDGVVEKFKDQGVQLIAVNLQETADTIKNTLERREIEVDVALDQDGVVSEKYRVNAIPMTVIIDGSGTVARCFVGGGPRFADDFQAALQAVIDGDATPPPMQ